MSVDVVTGETREVPGHWRSLDGEPLHDCPRVILCSYSAVPADPSPLEHWRAQLGAARLERDKHPAHSEIWQHFQDDADELESRLFAEIVAGEAVQS